MAAREVGFLGFGFLSALGFHARRPRAEAKMGSSLRPASGFRIETPTARERLAESKTIKSGGIAGVATVAAAGVEVAQEVLAETQDAVLPLVPYVDTLR